jgi:chromosome segregation ATPase
VRVAWPGIAAFDPKGIRRPTSAHERRSRESRKEERKISMTLTREELREELQAALAPLQQAVTVLQQDMTALRLDASAHTRALDQLLDRLQLDSRRLQAAINDIARENVTAGKMEAVHRDLNRIQLELARLAARVEPPTLNK